VGTIAHRGHLLADKLFVPLAIIALLVLVRSPFVILACFATRPVFNRLRITALLATIVLLVRPVHTNTNACLGSIALAVESVHLLCAVLVITVPQLE
jgi:hypothetical protein